MPKRSKETIAEDTLKILAELQKNAKENINTIAKHCGFTRQKAWRIIKQLEKKDQIWGYTAIFDQKIMGKKHFVLMAKRNTKKVEEETINQIISRKLEDFAKGLGVTVESSFYVHGEYDWVLTFTAEGITQARRFADSLLKLNPGILEKVTILQTLMFIRKQHILNPERKKLKDFL